MSNPDPSPSTRFRPGNQAAKAPGPRPDLGHLHVRPPMASKGRWVAASRRAGLSLSEWVIRELDRAAS